MQAASNHAPRVLAVLVSHDGAQWLSRTLDALEAQSHPNLTVVAVDNASRDGSRDLLIDRLGPERVLVAEIDLGFGAAVSMALDAHGPDTAPYVLLLHDDCELTPDAVEHLVARLERDPRLAIVGPKLRDWRDREVLQSAGWTVDISGRAHSDVDEGELDQGQRDHERQTLYVSTAAMLVRREVFERLGRFDRRFHVFRNDLDLCWRAWLAGHEVEVVPAAVGYHAAGAANFLRLGQTRFIGPRYFAERNTLAALLKNYGWARLLLVVPLYFLVGIAKVAGFLLTRRVSDAWQTVRAWLWNGYHLRETWRLRRATQAHRTRADVELKDLFARIAPRVRAYAEAIADWIAGGDLETPERVEVPDVPEAPPESASRRLLRLIVTRPVLVASVLLLAVFLGGTWPLLVPGELRGGELAAWPMSPQAFLVDYAAGWHEAGAFGTAEAPSPAQALLGGLHLLALGSTYVAPRLLLLGTVAAAWLLALRAAQPYSRRKLPRVVAATAYVLSPPALAALATGRVGALVVLAAAPGILAAGTTLARRSSTPQQAWRAVAAATLLGAVAGAFEPIVVPALLVTGIGALLVGMLRDVDIAWRAAFASRIVVAAVGPLVLLLPWSADLLSPTGPLLSVQTEVVGSELWQWLLLSPGLPGFPGLVAGIGFLLAGLLGLALGGPTRPLLVIGLWGAALAGAVGAWWLGRIGGPAWPGLPLILTAGAFAGLFAVAFATAGAQLTRHAFGWRQLASLATAIAVAVSLATVAGTLLRGPWGAYAVGTTPLPSFVVSAAEQGPAFRVLILGDQHGVVAWEVVEGQGPTMAAYGVPETRDAIELVASKVQDILTGGDPGAAARLGLLNVRYVYVPPGGTSARLDLVLRGQLGIEPRPVAEGRVFALHDWAPRAALAEAGVAAAVSERGELPEDAVLSPLEHEAPGRYAGRADEGGSLLLAEAADVGWIVTADGRRLPQASGPTARFDDVPPDARVEVAHEGGTTRTVAVTGQVLAVLLTISLALRPPSFARRQDDDAEPDLPALGRAQVGVGS